MSKKAPEPPDLGPMAESSAESARISQQMAADQLSWAKEQDGLNRQLLDRVVSGQETVQNETLKNAQEDRARYKDKYQPLEDNLIQEFQNYDSPEKQAQNAGRAMSDVSQSFDAARRNALQRLEGYGVDPSQTRNAALDIGVRTQQAAAQAGAATNSRLNTENTGRALRAEAINIGKGLPSQVAGSYGQSIAAGNSQVSNANQTTNTSTGALTSGNGAMGLAQQGYGQSANIQNQGYQNQMAQYNANQQATTGMLSAVGGVAGMFMADGGDVEGALPLSRPGAVQGPGDGSGIDDRVHIQASDGEFIIPADVVRKKGEEFFEKLIERYHTPAKEQREDAHTENIRSGRALNPSPRTNSREMAYG